MQPILWILGTFVLVTIAYASRTALTQKRLARERRDRVEDNAAKTPSPPTRKD